MLKIRNRKIQFKSFHLLRFLMEASLLGSHPLRTKLDGSRPRHKCRKSSWSHTPPICPCNHLAGQSFGALLLENGKEINVISGEMTSPIQSTQARIVMLIWFVGMKWWKSESRAKSYKIKLVRSVEKLQKFDLLELGLTWNLPVAFFTTWALTPV